MITAGLRRAIGAAAGQPAADPMLTPGPVPGSYASSLPFRLGPDPRAAAAALAARLSEQLWIDTAEVTGPGFVTATPIIFATSRALPPPIAMIASAPSSRNRPAPD